MDSPASSITVLIHGMAHGGEGVGRLPDGRAVFVPGVIPGERVRIEIVSSRKRWARADRVEVSEASPHRVDPPCPHFHVCGGCQWQHIDLSRQRELKQEIVTGQLQHLGRLTDPPVEAIRSAGSDDGFGYRNHVTFAIDGQGRTALHRRGSRRLVAIDSCPLLHPLLRSWHESLPPLRGARSVELRAGIRTGQRLANVTGSIEAEAGRAAYERGVPLGPAGIGEITEVVGIERYRISSKSFFQVNTEGADVLLELVLEMLAPSPEDVVLDAYAGVGLFSLPLARKTTRVLAVERSAASLRDLRHHARGLPIHIIGMDLENAAAQLPKHLDLVVADPPRQGLGEAAASLLAGKRPRTLVMVSCDPAAFARDAAELGKQGYQATRVVPIDLFPHTFHVEIVAAFRRAPA